VDAHQDAALRVEAQTVVASMVAHSTTRLGAVVTELREALERFKL
jgi:hypothetical protein